MAGLWKLTHLTPKVSTYRVIAWSCITNFSASMLGRITWLRTNQHRSGFPLSASHCVQSPHQLFGSGAAEDKAGHPKDGKKAGKKEVKDGKKKKKKGKKSSSASAIVLSSCLATIIIPGILSIRGSSSPSDDDSSSAEKSDLELDDCASLFGLGKRDLARPAGSARLDDLSCRQLGFAVSNVVEAVSPSDIFELGGELAARLNSLSWFLPRVMSC